MTARNPAASVVVATWNRERQLERFLEGIAAQAAAPPFELIVIDNASTDGTPAVLDRWMASGRLDLRVVRAERNGGPSAARNTGWRMAASPYVLFTDDDCVPQPGWVGGLFAALEAGADIAQGTTLPDPEQAVGRGPWSHSVHIARLSPYFETCNLSYRRDLLARLDGFDERFAGATFGEDTDLGCRARALGASCAYVPDAVVHHEVTSSSYLTYLRARRRRAGAARAVKRNPEVRRDLYGWMWLHAGHPPALACAVTLGAAALRPRSPLRVGTLAGALGWYLWFRARRDQLHGRRRSWPVNIPLALVADVVEVGVLAAASVENRTLLL